MTDSGIGADLLAPAVAERRAFAAKLTFFVTTIGSCVWFLIASLIASYAVMPDMPLGLVIFFLLSLPCSVPLAGVAVILGRCVSLFRYSRILSAITLAGSVSWLLCFTIETRVTMGLAWQNEEFTGIDHTEYVYTLFGLPPLMFGACLFSFIASSVHQRTNEIGV